MQPGSGLDRFRIFMASPPKHIVQRLSSKKSMLTQHSLIPFGTTLSLAIIRDRSSGVGFMAESENKIERIHCNKCGHKTKHIIVATRRQDGSEPYDREYSISWTTIYDMLECQGCEEITVCRRFYFSEWNRGDVQINYYPPRIARRLPLWKDDLPDEIVSLLEEVYAALQANSRSLAMMGARALIDMVILQKVGDVGSFPQKLTALEKAGFLSDKNREVLEAALDMGNAAAHRGHRPNSKHVRSVMDIVENLLQATILQTIVDDLKKATPPRRKRKGKE